MRCCARRGTRRSAASATASNAASGTTFSAAAKLAAETANAASSTDAANSGSGTEPDSDSGTGTAEGSTGADAGAATSQAASTSAEAADAAASQSSGSASAESTTDNLATPPQDLVIDELGYTTSSKGYVYYGIRLSNPNDGYSAELPKIQATGRDEDGDTMFADTHTLRDIYPGESVYYGFRVGNGTVPSTVDLDVSVGTGNWKQSNSKRDDLYSFGNLVDSGTQDGVNHFTGEITLNSDIAGAKKPAITVIVRDEDGGMIYGVTAFLQSNLVVGVPTSFDIEARDMPENASTFDVHAMPWSA